MIMANLFMSGNRLALSLGVKAEADRTIVVREQTPACGQGGRAFPFCRPNTGLPRVSSGGLRLWITELGDYNDEGAGITISTSATVASRACPGLIRPHRASFVRRALISSSCFCGSLLLLSSPFSFRTHQARHA